MDLPAPIATTTAAPPYLLVRPAGQAVPVVFASPHSGRL